MPEDTQTAMVTLQAKPLLRVQAVRSLQIVGLLVAALGGSDLMNLVTLFSPDAAAWLAITGASIRFGAEPLILLLGDLLDDGIKNDSFKLTGKLGLFLMLGALCFLSLWSVGCNSLSLGITPEGCAMVTYGRGAKTYSAGPCIGPDGKIDKYRAEWRNMDGTALRADRYVKTGKSSVWYQAGDGTWLQWDSKAGVMLGPVPSEVTPVIPVIPVAVVVPEK